MPDRIRSQSLVGTMRYAAPETLNTNNIFETPADIWSLGVVAYEFATGKDFIFTEAS